MAKRHQRDDAACGGEQVVLSGAGLSVSLVCLRLCLDANVSWLQVKELGCNSRVAAQYVLGADEAVAAELQAGSGPGRRSSPPNRRATFGSDAPG